jgi:HK97 family phage prohead protease
MPWKIVAGGEDCPFEVVKEDGGERVACHPTRDEAEAQVRALYANEPRAADEMLIEVRSVNVDSVDSRKRIITVVAAPYGRPAQVEYRSEIWNELFERGAFAAVTTAPHRVRANRGHDKNRTVGKVTKFWPERDEGLVADVWIAETPLGEDTLVLAAGDCLSASVGFGVRPSGQVLERHTMTRRIKSAYLDHLSFVESPAYADARVLSVRDTTGGGVAKLEPIRTPLLDQFAADEVLRWASERLNQQ